MSTVADAARSGLLDIAAHPDLLSLGPHPPAHLRPPAQPRPPPGTSRYPTYAQRRSASLYEPAVEAIAEAGIAVEVSTAGLRKPAGELYPSRSFLEMCVDAGIAVALSSDAHRPQDVGADYEQALALLDEVGVRELCVFEGRARRLVPIGETSASSEASRR